MNKTKTTLILALLFGFSALSKSQTLTGSQPQAGLQAKEPQTKETGPKSFDNRSYFSAEYAGSKFKYDFDRYTDGDFHRWQAEFRAELRDKLGLTRLEHQYPGYKPTAEKLDEEDCGSFTRERWIIMTEPEFPLPMVVLKPKNLSGRVPVVLAIQGHSLNPELFAGVYRNEKDRISGEDGERNVGIQAVQEGYIAIVPTTRAFGQTRLPADLKKNALSSCAEYSHRDMIAGRTIIGDRVWDCSRIIDWAFDNLPVDRTNVIVTGNSGGGTVTVYAGAIDTRISISMPGSAFCPYEPSIGLISHCDCNYIHGILDLGNMQDIAGLTAPRIFHAIHGVKDNIFPIEATRRAMAELSRIYTAAGAGDRCSIFEGPEGHRYYKAGAWDFVRANLLPVRPDNVVTAPEAPFEFAPLEMHVFPEKSFPITKYGARKGDIKATMAAFDKAMTACSKAGGGKIVVPEGEWLTGPISFKSNCNLYLSEGAKLLFTDDLQYFPVVKTSWGAQECMNYSPLIYAFECENVAISGPGTIESEMDFWRSWFDRPACHLNATRQLCVMTATGVPAEQRMMAGGDARMRPLFVEFNRCTNVQLADFKLRNSPMWCLHLFMCKDVWAHGLDVFADGHNSDGIDLDMTQHAVVENCTFCQSDDAIVIKAGRNQDGWRLNMPTTDIVVRNCDILSGGSVVAVGSEMSAGVRRVYAHHCRGVDMSHFMQLKTNERRGGFIEDITVEDCQADSLTTMVNIETDVMYQYRDLVPTFEVRKTDIRRIAVRNVYAKWAEKVYNITGDADKPVEDVTISHLTVGEVSKKMGRAVNVDDLKLNDITVGNYSRTGQSKSSFNKSWRKYTTFGKGKTF